ncbi:heparinase II/III domain-containing protein [Phreatobacter sp.]|uniref:heparinase II/III domain-containing protein n=1 Tax=Phreatobacter sp. TaxID=1966341 RepID=UPI003F71C0DC
MESFAGTCFETMAFSFYGERHECGPDIDWRANPGSWHWGHDLNRFGFLVLYGDASSRQTAERLFGLIKDWLTKNMDQATIGSGYPWGNLLNVAIRTENWWRFVTQAVGNAHCELEAPRTQLIARSVVQQARLVFRLVRSRGFKDNWSVIGLRSAVYIMSAIKGFPHRERHLQIARSYLRRVVEEQILPDGVQQELVPHYHWVVLELIASIRDLLADALGAPDPQADDAISSMADFLASVMSPSGAVIALGDSDPENGARIARFLASLRTRGEAQFDRADELAADAGQAQKVVPTLEPDIKLFPYAGLACIRHPSTGSLLVFDGGPFGTAHQHEDALSLSLSCFGEDLIVDPGRYLYEMEADRPWAYLKSTAAHSTVRIDGLDQNARATAADWRRQTSGEPRLDIDANGIVLSATYNQGYGPDCMHVLHHRQIGVSNQGLLVEVSDCLLGDGEHDIELQWQVSPGPFSLQPGLFRCVRGVAQLEITWADEPSLEVHVAEGERQPFRGWFAPGLNRMTPSPMLILRCRRQLPVTLCTTLRSIRVQPA